MPEVLNTYTVEHRTDRIIVYGTVPLAVVAALCDYASGLGFDTLDLEAAKPLGALLVIRARNSDPARRDSTEASS